MVSSSFFFLKYPPITNFPHFLKLYMPSSLDNVFQNAKNQQAHACKFCGIDTVSLLNLLLRVMPRRRLPSASLPNFNESFFAHPSLFKINPPLLNNPSPLVEKGLQLLKQGAVEPWLLQNSISNTNNYGLIKVR